MSAPGPAAADSPQDERADASRRLAELRALLLGPEQAELERLRRRLDDPDIRAEELSQLVAEAIALRSRRDRVLQSTLNPMVEEALRVSVERNPHLLATSLFPIIGEAVRKAVAHALRGMVESLNHILERSVSWESVKWRWEALRTGRSFGEVVLTRSLRYRVEQVFLVHRETGLLLQHVAAGNAAVQDTDLVSGMLTAVQDFVRDSFTGRSSDELETMQVGDYTVWLQHGPLALLAAVVTGAPPPELRDFLESTLEKIHSDYGAAISQFSGDASALDATRPLLEACLLGRQGRPAAAKPPRKAAWALALLGVVVVAALVYVWDQNRRWNRYIARLRTEPGIVLTSAQKSWGAYSLTGLRDPLATDPEQLLRESGLNPDKVSERWEPYLSLDPSFALSRKINELKSDIEAQVIRFPVNSARIEPSEMAKLDQIQVQVLGLQQYGRIEHGGMTLEISGHTDQSGAENANALLSKRRAEEVARALEARGVSPEVLRTTGVGATQPSLRGTATVVEDLDRRVTFRVLLPPGRGKR
jgi:outer membrane protein OmpA-like peptidoglycan-associated protein